ncbi:uncharacterized protein BDCG_16272 [Blastomyces dermatitidis ER-3]|uniref:Uncharacterized protein n=1 Tax=Ajellomyces dermatitidis (strain ER-3 / ATCC MYA-2586) TaxID=559297 RepID=A0ABX2VR38_AJEDR|nr:uncharacterized protein BDCG_16272 [Blastomyces dermatitidis ER-3]OAS99701.1 hypothetical protein BDCG_16272 [Blastomyces dermatitidis ER-3]
MAGIIHGTVYGAEYAVSPERREWLGVGQHPTLDKLELGRYFAIGGQMYVMRGSLAIRYLGPILPSWRD